MSVEDEPPNLPHPSRRPHLLPYNRRLRHLQIIAIRNLTLLQSLTPDEDEPDGAPAEDGEDLQSHSPTPSRIASNSKKKVRPRSSRRRSTLNWVGAAPSVRQKKLEDITNQRLCDVWFSLHEVPTQAQAELPPVYISEVVYKTMNPTFRTFALEDCGPRANRSDRIVMRIWAKNQLQKEFSLVASYDLKFQELIFLSKDLTDYPHQLPLNTPVLHLTDGYYAPLIDPPADVAAIPLAPPKHPLTAIATKPLPSSSLDALLRLQNLDACIQDALKTRQELQDQISSFLDRQSGSRELLARASIAQEREKDVDKTLIVVQKRLSAVRKRRAEIENDLKNRRDALRTAKSQQDQGSRWLSAESTQLQVHKTRVKEVTISLESQRRRVATELSRTFPIEPLGDAYSMFFSIRNCPLPNSDFSSSLSTAILSSRPNSSHSSPNVSPHPTRANRSLLNDYNTPPCTAAALGHVAQLLHLLSKTLDILLPYPVTPRASTSMIYDPISVLADGKRQFPLYQKGSQKYRFEYGVFLVNKDIEFLVGMLGGGRVVDIRCTLANLKLALEVCGSQHDYQINGHQDQKASSVELKGLGINGVKGVRSLLGSGVLSPNSEGSSSRRSSSAGDGAADHRIEMLNDELNRKVRELALEDEQGAETASSGTSSPSVPVAKKLGSVGSLRGQQAGRATEEKPGVRIVSRGRVIGAGLRME